MTPSATVTTAAARPLLDQATARLLTEYRSAFRTARETARQLAEANRRLRAQLTLASEVAS